MRTLDIGFELNYYTNSQLYWSKAMELERLVQIIISLGFVNFEVDAGHKTIGLGYSPDGVEQHDFIVWIVSLNPEAVLLRATSMACANPDPVKFREMCLYLNQYQDGSPSKWFLSDKGHVTAELLLFFPTRKMIDRALNLLLGEFSDNIGDLVETFELAITES